LPSRALEEAEASAGPLAGVVEQALARRQAVELAQEPVSLEAAEWAGPPVVPEFALVAVAQEEWRDRVWPREARWESGSVPGGLLLAEPSREPVSPVVVEWAEPLVVEEPAPVVAEFVPVALAQEERRDRVSLLEARREPRSAPGGLLLAEPSREPPVSPGAPGRGSMDPQAS